MFPEGGYQLSAAGKAELSSNIVPKLTGLQNAQVVVYGYTDNLPVGPQLLSGVRLAIAWCAGGMCVGPSSSAAAAGRDERQSHLVVAAGRIASPTNVRQMSSVASSSVFPLPH